MISIECMIMRACKRIKCDVKRQVAPPRCVPIACMVSVLYLHTYVHTYVRSSNKHKQSKRPHCCGWYCTRHIQCVLVCGWTVGSSCVYTWCIHIMYTYVCTSTNTDLHFGLPEDRTACKGSCTLVFPICHSVSGRCSDRNILATACFGSAGRGAGSLAARQLYFARKSFAFTCTG